jgi:high-affinity iron transporter
LRRAAEAEPLGTTTSFPLHFFRWPCGGLAIRSVASAAVFALLLVGPGQAVSSLDSSAEVGADAARSVQLLDYIAADYPGAVANGEVTNEFEYAEQIEFAGSISEMLNRIAAPELAIAAARSLAAAVAEKADPELVTHHARTARRLLVDRFGLVQTPDHGPDLGRGQQLYEDNCAKCHALDGNGDTPTSADFEVPPARFRDPALLAGLSPFRVFNNITFGIDGTEMPSFDVLSADQRWDIAFYVLALGHGGAVPNAAAPENLPPDLRPTLALLATSSDSGLGNDLAAHGIPAVDRPAVVTWLRATAPATATADSPLAAVRTRLAVARRALGDGDFTAAHGAVLDAYLDGFEALEAPLSAVDIDLTRAAEASFSRLRSLARVGDRNEGLREIDRLRTLIDRADVALASRTVSGNDAGLFFASFVILVREGLEGVLLVSLLLTVLSRLGRDDARRWVHAAWIAALVAGAGTWVAASTIIEVSGRSREMLEGIIALIAAAVLFSVAHWFVSKVESEHWLRYLRERLADHLSGNRMFALAGLSFLAVYREVFETTLFYQALLLDVPVQGRGSVFAGIAAGAVVVATVSLIIFKAGKRLPLGPLFSTSGVLLYALCVMFVGEGLAALREAGAIASYPLGFNGISWLGLYPDSVGLSAQAVLVFLAVGTFAAARLRSSATPA